MEQPLVSIACITFNQAKYIRQCLDGFVMQKTSFPVEIVIHDDASTDGTQDIIKEYVEKYPQFQWKPILQKENQYSKGNGILAPFVYPQCTGKYIALCEGDDYWIEPKKLQMQVDLIEKESDTAMIYSPCKRFLQAQGCFSENMGKETSFEDLLCSFNNAIPTASILYKKEVYDEYNNQVDPKEKEWKMGDYPFNLYVLMNYGTKMLDEVTSVYRIVGNSASHNHDEIKLIPYYKSIFDIKRYFCELIPKDARLRKRMCHNYLHFAYALFRRTHHDSVSQLIDDVYLYMGSNSCLERIVHDMIMSCHCPQLVCKLVLRLYASRIMSV